MVTESWHRLKESLDKLVEKVFIRNFPSTKIHIYHRKFLSAGGGWKLEMYIREVLIALFIYAAYTVVLTFF